MNLVSLQSYDPNKIKRRFYPRSDFTGYSCAKLLHPIILWE